jgi:hypothetical protein
VWVITDLATAGALNLTPVSVQFAPGGPYVAPTPESLAAAARTMKRDPSGTLVPDPDAGPPADGAAPYPLTFVEHALAPAQPLRTEGDAADPCGLRSVSQGLLKDWLAYVTGPGQALLPPVMALPADLRAEAGAAVDVVGASPTTGPCASETPGGGDAPGPGGSGAFGGDLSGGGFAGGDGGLGGPGDYGSFGPDGGDLPAELGAPADGTGATAGSTPPAVTAADDRPLPEYAGNRFAGPAGAALALTGLVGLTTLAAMLTSRAGRPPVVLTGGSGPGPDPEPLDVLDVLDVQGDPRAPAGGGDGMTIAQDRVIR